MWVVFIPFVLFHFFVLPFIHCFGSTANIFLREELLALVSIPKQIFNANCHWVWTLLSQRHWAECSILCSWWFQWIWLMLKLWGQKRVHAKLFLAACRLLLLFLAHEQVLELLRVWHSCCLVVYIQIEAVSKIDEGRLKKNLANEFGLLNSKKIQIALTHLHNAKVRLHADVNFLLPNKANVAQPESSRIFPRNCNCTIWDLRVWSTAQSRRRFEDAPCGPEESKKIN